MDEINQPLIRRQVRSPRSAAIAGILFAILRIISIVLITSVSSPAELSIEWLETWAGTSRGGVAACRNSLESGARGT